MQENLIKIPKILVVDDEEDLQLLIKQTFRRKIRANEIEFIFAFNGYQALKALEDHNDVDMILSDINMPEMDGLTLLNIVKDKYPLLRTVVVSAYGDMENVRTAMNNGAFDFVTKPIDFTDLEITMNKTLEDVGKLRQAAEYRDKIVAFEEEMKIGQRIQNSFLPKEMPIIDNWEIDAFYKPAREVSGDFYDVFILENINRVAFVIADVCGKGVGAALFMALIRSLIRTFSNHDKSDEHTIENITRRIQNYLEKNHDETGMFVTLVIGFLNPIDGKVTYINAGHNPPVIISNNSIIKTLLPGGPALGVFPDSKYKVDSFTISSGQTLFLYTDGVTEAFNEESDFYGEERLKAVILKPDMKFFDLLLSVSNDVLKFIQKAPQSDDITLLAIKKNN